MRLNKMIIALAMCVSAAPVQAVIIASQNYDSENGGVGALNYPIPGVSNGTIDLIADNTLGIRCAGNTGMCLDLDGSTGDAGDLTSDPISLSGGSYVFRFDLSGNQRGGASDTTTVYWNALEVGVINVDPFDPFQTYSFPFIMANAGYVTFTVSTAGGDNLGPIFDNVELEFLPADTVPEPAVGGMMITGLAIFGAAMRRRQGNRSRSLTA